MDFLDPAEARSLLEQAWAGGVVLDYVPVMTEEDLGDGAVLRRVVSFTARGLSVVRGEHPGPEIDPSSIPGGRITVDEFYGWRVDRDNRRLLMPGYHLVNEDPAGSQEGGRNESGRVPLRTPWIWSDDPNEPIEIDTIHEFAYGDAFLEPPYGITLPPRAAQDLFFAIDDVLLKRPGPETDIWHFTSEWDPEGGACWSPYFEWNWFGCCMWTVRTGPHQVIVIGASATD